MMSIVSALSSGKIVFILMLVIVILTIIDSQFVNVFYGTDLGTPGNMHLLLFVSLIVIASIINTMSLGFVKSNDRRETTNRILLHRIAYFGTVALQSATVIILLIIISEMLIFHNYDKLSSLLVVYFSHLWSSFILGLLSLRFIQWYRISKSFSLLIYGVVFGFIIFITIITLPLLTEQFINQPQSIYPRHYSGLIAAVIVPSRDIAFIYGLGNYVLPLLIILSWILTVLLLKTYIGKIGKKKFWLIVSIPLLYQLFSFVVRDSNLVTDPALVEIVYSQQFQFLFAISYQVSGSFFAIALLGVARKMKQKGMKNYLITSSIGIICLFSSVQPGMPFYAAYPPFGLVTLLFLGLSSYLLLIGILGCAANVSRDNELRREIYKGLIESDTFKNIGMAEMQLEMEKKVLPLVSKADDIRSMEPDEEDVKTMINDVLNELYSKRSHIESGK
jgi:hypothetical protein